MKKLFTIIAMVVMLAGISQAKAVSTAQTAGLFHNPSEVKAIVLDNNELSETKGQFFWLAFAIFALFDIGATVGLTTVGVLAATERLKGNL